MSDDPVQRLAALVAQCSTAGAQRTVLLLRAARLPPGLSRPHHIRLAEAALSPLFTASRAEMLRLPGPAIAVFWRGDAESALLEAAARLEHLLEDGPAGTPALTDLLTLFELPQDGALLLDQVRAEQPALPPPDPAQPALDAATLVALEAVLAQADLTRFVRRRPVWRIGRHEPALAWEKRTLSIAELADAVAPGRDLKADPWLFRRLTRTLDRRMLALLNSPGELVAAQPFSLDLNVASILGVEFLRFDAALHPALRGRLLIELTPADIIADPGAFAFARGFVRTRGYRLLLRVPDPALLPVLRINALEVDYLQLAWSDALAPLPCPAPGPDRLVLTGANGPAAMRWARRNGIRLVSGSDAERGADPGAEPLGERGAAA